VTRDAWQSRDFASSWDHVNNVRTNPERESQLALLTELVVQSTPRHLLDLGIGSALVESAMHRRYPEFFSSCRVTGLDASDAMLGLARQRCDTESIGNLQLAQVDFADIATFELLSPPDTVICVQALHEVDHDIKRQVFEYVRGLLAPGRPFYILDRFTYPADHWLDDWQATWRWMRSKVDEEVMDFDDYHEQYRRKTDHIASVEDYSRWLEASGFRTSCPYRGFNRALIIARA
jgi:ubiquinone/menaquinone biosynthesis C-methylase UbiE